MKNQKVTFETYDNSRSDFCTIDDDLDMFGDTPANDSKIEADEVQWEYKESKDGDLIGPCSTAKMLKVQKFSSNQSIACF